MQEQHAAGMHTGYEKSPQMYVPELKASLQFSFIGVVGTQGQPPQNVPQWRIDYFPKELLKKWPMPKGHCALSSSVAQMQEINLS